VQEKFFDNPFIDESETSIVSWHNFNWLYFLFIPAANFIFIYMLARHVLYCVLYPYQNSYQREGLDRGFNQRFGAELIYYLE
jgi:hypothetical protein